MTLKGSATTLGSLDAAVENAESAKILGESAGGALINADGNDAVRTTHEDISSAALTVAGSFTTAGDMSFEAASNSDLRQYQGRPCRAFGRRGDEHHGRFDGRTGDGRRRAFCWR